MISRNRKPKRVEDSRIRSFIGLLIILILASAFMTYSEFNNPSMGVEYDSKKLLSSIDVKNGNLGFVTNDEIDSVKLSEIIKKDYQNIKDETGIKSDFCIYFEDEQGNILNLDGELAKPEENVCIGKEIKNI